MTLSDLYMNLALMVGVSLLVAAAMVVVPNIDNIQAWKRRKAITGTRRSVQLSLPGKRADSARSRASESRHSGL
jgi:hypothetical protein